MKDIIAYRTSNKNKKAKGYCKNYLNRLPGCPFSKRIGCRSRHFNKSLGKTKGTKKALRDLNYYSDY